MNPTFAPTTNAIGEFACPAIAPSGSTTPSEEILGRLEELQSLTAQELDLYRQSVPTTDAEKLQQTLVSIVIPVYNEQETLATVLSRVAALPLRKQIVIVDDCSTDGTTNILGKLDGIEDLVIVRKEENAGKGAALRTAFAHTKGDIVVVQDADLEYDPKDIPPLLLPLIRDEADVVYGSRFLAKDHQDKSWVHRFGNATLTNALNILIGLKLTDMETCYKAFRGDVIRQLPIVQNRFGIEPEMTAKLARRGYRFLEVPISYQPRGYDEGKKIGVRDLFNAFYCIARYGFAD